jgi:hypothetical protein
MSNTIFFKIDFNVKSFRPVLLPAQEEALSETLESYADIAEIVIPDEVCMRYPMKSVFATNDYTYGTDRVLKINSVHILHYEEVTYYHGVDTAVQPNLTDLDKYFEYLINQGQEALATKLNSGFAGAGLVYDLAAKVAEIKSVPGTTAAVAGFREELQAKYPIPALKATGFHIEQDTWDLMIRNAVRMENTLMVGATGTGKTELIQHLADSMGKKLYIVDMGTVQDAQSALLGVHRLNDKGFSEFDYAPFAKYIQEDCIILLDELSR